ncbi:unnamed protein product, partial [Rotaria sp. Silwood2]
MNEEKPTENISTPSKAAITARTSPYTHHERRRIAQNFLLIWMDTGMDPSNKDCQVTLAQLQSVVND